MEILNNAEARYVFNGSSVENVVTSNTNSVELNNAQGLLITKTASPTTFLAGEIIDYTIDITNSSSNYLNGVRIIDNLGMNNLAYVLGSATLTVGTLTYPVNPISTNPLTFTLQELALGQSMTLRYKAQVIFNLPTTVNSITNSVTGIGYTATGTINGYSSFTIQKKTNNTLSLEKLSSEENVYPNEVFDYIIQISNNSSLDAQVTQLSDQLPANFEVISISMQVGSGNIVQLSEDQYSIDGTNLLLIPSATGNNIVVPANTLVKVIISGYFQ